MFWNEIQLDVKACAFGFQRQLPSSTTATIQLDLSENCSHSACRRCCEDGHLSKCLLGSSRKESFHAHSFRSQAPRPCNSCLALFRQHCPTPSCWDSFCPNSWHQTTIALSCFPQGYLLLSTSHRSIDSLSCCYQLQRLIIILWVSSWPSFAVMSPFKPR